MLQHNMSGADTVHCFQCFMSETHQPKDDTSMPCEFISACCHVIMYALQCNTFTGTVTYMSPERINSQPYSFPADIW